MTHYYYLMNDGEIFDRLEQDDYDLDSDMTIFSASQLSNEQIYNYLVLVARNWEMYGGPREFEELYTVLAGRLGIEMDPSTDDNTMLNKLLEEIENTMEPANESDPDFDYMKYIYNRCGLEFER